MSRRVSPSTDQVYGLQRVTRIWGVSRATVYHRQPVGGDRAQAARAARCDGGRGAGAGDPAAPAGQPVPWRRVPQAVGAAALRRHPHQPAPRPAADARAWSAGASARRSPSRLARPRRHDHHRKSRCDVGYGPDLGDYRRRASGGVHHGRSLLGRVRWPSRQPQRRSLRGGVRERFGAFKNDQLGRMPMAAYAPRSVSQSCGPVHSGTRRDLAWHK